MPPSLDRVRVLVTGAAGFISSHVAEALGAAGHDVCGVDALLPTAHGDDPAVPAGVDVASGDLRDPDVARRAVAGVDAVVHHAAMVGLGADLLDIDADRAAGGLGFEAEIDLESGMRAFATDPLRRAARAAS